MPFNTRSTLSVNSRSGTMTRAQNRNVFFYDDAHEIGGLVLNPSVNQKVLLQMLQVLIRSELPYNVVHRETKVPLVPCASAVVLGIYDILSEGSGWISSGHTITKGKTGKITVTDECSYFRALSVASTPRTDQFKQQVRERDGMCVITKVRYIYTWAAFHAAHICPAAYENLLDKDDALGSCITLKNSPRESGIHSVQNGILLSSHLHALFDLSFISINPDVCVLAPAFPTKAQASGWRGTLGWLQGSLFQHRPMGGGWESAGLLLSWPAKWALRTRWLAEMAFQASNPHQYERAGGTGTWTWLPYGVGHDVWPA